MNDSDDWIVDDDDGRPAKEEPDCGFCNDSGCPECDPSPQARQDRMDRFDAERAAFAAAVERGEAHYADESPF